MVLSSAEAGHFHDALNRPCSFNITPHGLVHGDNEFDGYAWSRVEGGYCGYYKKCAIGNYDISPTNSIRGTETSGNAGIRCEVQTYGGNNEQRAWARVYASNGSTSTTWIETHYHNAHRTY